MTRQTMEGIQMMMCGKNSGFLERLFAMMRNAY